MIEDVLLLAVLLPLLGVAAVFLRCLGLYDQRLTDSAAPATADKFRVP
jgi:hypothetical protein